MRLGRRGGRSREDLAPPGDDAVGLLARALRRAAEDVLVDVLDPDAIVRGGVLDRHGDERQRAPLVLLDVAAAPEQLGQEAPGRRDSSPRSARTGSACRACTSSRCRRRSGRAWRARTARPCRRRRSPHDAGSRRRARGSGDSSDLRTPRAQVAGERGQRLGHERRAMAIVGIDVGVLVRQLPEQHVGLGVVGRARRALSE